MQNELIPSQGTTDETTAIEKNEPIAEESSLFSCPPIAGFWRRFFAWVVDSFILGTIGQLLGLIFSSYLFSIGPYGRPIGLLFVLPYFGIGNSKICGGQTLGKRWMKIAVRNKDNEPISIWRSLIRIIILYFPVLVNGWAIPLFQNAVISWILSVILFGFGGAILYTMVFNKKSRQGFHDMILGTYVVHLPGKAITTFPKTKRIHWVISSAMIGIVAIGLLIATFVIPSGKKSSTLQPLIELNNILLTDNRLLSTGVSEQTSSSSIGSTKHYLIITAWYKGNIKYIDPQEIANDLVFKVFDNIPNPEKYDAIQVKITSQYDIGIASLSRYATFSNTIENWREGIKP